MKAATTILALATAVLAAPSQIARRTPDARIDPILSQYNVATGAVTYDTGIGHIQKQYGNTPDETTLLRFDFPEDTAGYNCEVFFPLDSASVATGSQRAQIFSSLAPADQTTTSWPNGNLRDQHLGDAYFEAPGSVTYEATYNIYATGKFPCPAGYSLGAEIVGRWDVVEIGWTQSSTAGPYIEVTA